MSMFYVDMVPTPTYVCYKSKYAERLLVLRDIEDRLFQHCLQAMREAEKDLSSSNQSGLTTQISTHSRAIQQGRVKCRRHVTVTAVSTQEAISEEGGKKS